MPAVLNQYFISRGLILAPWVTSKNKKPGKFPADC